MIPKTSSRPAAKIDKNLLSIGGLLMDIDYWMITAVVLWVAGIVPMIMTIEDEDGPLYARIIFGAFWPPLGLAVAVVAVVEMTKHLCRKRP